MKKDHFILKVRQSRKGFFTAYLMAIIVIIILSYLYLNEHKIEKIPLLISTVFIVLCIKYVEYNILSNWWAITDSTVVQSTGLFNKNIRSVDFPAISDFDIDQAFFKRIFDYGDVNIYLFSPKTKMTIKNINNPEEFFNVLESSLKKWRMRMAGKEEEPKKEK